MSWEIAISGMLSAFTFSFYYLLIHVDENDWPLCLLFQTLGLITSLVGLGIINQFAVLNSATSIELLLNDLIIVYLIGYVLIGGYIYINTIKNVMTGKKKKHFQGQY